MKQTWSKSVVHFLILVGTVLGAIATTITLEIKIEAAPLTQSKPEAKKTTETNAIDKISIHFPELTDINDIIKVVALWTGRKIIMDRKVKQKVQIISPAQVSPAEGYQIFLSALNAVGLTVVETGKITRIVERSKAPRSNLKVLRPRDYSPATDEMLTQVFSLRYIPVEQTRLVLGKILSTNAMIAYLPSNTLIVSDTGNNLRRVSQIIDIIDIKTHQPELFTFPLRHLAPSEALKTIDQLKGHANGTSLLRQFHFITHEAAESLLAFGPRRLYPALQATITKIDLPTADQSVPSHFHFRPLQFSDAKKTAATLNALRQVGGASKTQSNDLKIAADDPSNSLIVMGSKTAFQATEKILRTLDVRRPQVFIEVDILDIQSTHAFRFATSLFAGAGSSSSSGSKALIGWEAQAVSPMVLAGSSAGDQPQSTDQRNSVASIFAEELTVNLVTAKAVEIEGLGKIRPAALLKLIKSDSTTKVLSSPYILTTDGEEAFVSVGQTVLFNTVTNSLFGAPVSKVEKENVNLSVKILPTVSNSSYLSLKLEIEASDVVGFSEDGLPRITKRKSTQTIVAQDKQTVVISGLRKRTTLKTHRKVPLFGDIPIIGALFRQKTTTELTGQLLLVLRAHIVHGSADLAAIYKRKTEALGGLASLKLPSQMNSNE